ncbi:MAG: 2-dehydropantoate 2-reductase, partial [Opitutae bacterium]
MAVNLGKVGLVGPGAIGGYYGGMLAHAGQDVHFLFRSTYEDILREGLSLVHHAENKRISRVEPLHAHENAENIGPCDLVIIASKTTSNHSLGELINPLLGAGTSLLTLQNGMGNVENLRKLFGEDRNIIGGLCFTCINRTSPAVIESLLPGYVQFGQLGGCLSEHGNQIADAFAEAGIKIRKADSLDEALWRKLCWNIPFNGLSIVAGGITTDLILSNPELKKRAWDLMLEVQEAARAYGVEIEDSFLQRQFDLTEPMGPYKPSSLIDFLAGKTVEIESIWGEPLKRGKEMGLMMPELEKLYT